jgi:hypothetical protein
MNKEELLMPRYKVINIWPDMSNYGHYQGQVITMIKLNDGGMGWPTFKVTFYPSFYDNYPHLFKPIHWADDRRVEDMPEYVTCISTPDQKIMPGMVLKITEWFASGCGRSGDHVVFPYTKCFLPATKDEYLEYIKGKEGEGA